MKKNTFIPVRHAIGVMVCAFLVGSAIAEQTIQIAKHTATFVQVRYDYPSSGQSTWYYCFTSGAKPAISHITFALNYPGISILGAGMWEDGNMDKLLYKAGMPEPGSFPAAPKGDPTTKITGLKFDLGFDEGASRCYYFTVNGNYTAQDMTVAIKAGNGFTTGVLPGPTGDVMAPDRTSSIGDRVWIDTNANGIQDAGEVGLAGVTVNLLSSDNEVLDTTVTDASGLYLFDGLVDGAYRVQFVRPAGYAFTFQYTRAMSSRHIALVGTVSSDTDSNADAVTGLTDLIELPADTADLSIDAGLVASDASLMLTKQGTFNPGTTNPWDLCTAFGPVHHFNALILGDLAAFGGDTEGRLAVGGNASITANYSVGFSAVGWAVSNAFGGTVDAFIVAGDLTDGSWGVNGNVVYGGERTGAKRWMSSGNLVRKVVPVTFRKDGNVPSDGSGMTFDSMRTNLEARSEHLAAFADRGVLSVDNGDPYYLTLTATNATFNVFNVSTAVWNGSGKQIKVIAPAGSTVLINVHGSSVSIVNSTMVVEGTTLEYVLVHYVDATNVTTSGFDHNASVLAMKAGGTLAGGAINGRAVFGGSITTTNGFEFHNFYFKGVLSDNGAAVPARPSMQYTFTVVNTGNAVLEGVAVTDPLVAIAGDAVTLQPGATNVLTATLILSDETLAQGVLTNTAAAVGTTLLGLKITASASHVEVFPPVDDPPSGPSDDGQYEETDKADFVIQSVDVTPSPSVAGARFTASVRIKNEGQRPGDAGVVEFWVNNTVYAARPEGDPTASVAAGVIGVGETKVVELANLRAPFETGTFHTLAVVNRAASTEEWSYGNNHGGATYTVEYLTVNVTTTPEGMLLSWNSLPGYYYFVERANGLDQPFTDIVDNLSATPPVNTYLDTSLPGGAAFYRVWGYRP